MEIKKGEMIFSFSPSWALPDHCHIARANLNYRLAGYGQIDHNLHQKTIDRIWKSETAYQKKGLPRIRFQNEIVLCQALIRRYVRTATEVNYYPRFFSPSRLHRQKQD